VYATTTTGLVRAPRSEVYAALLDPHAVQAWRVPDGMTAEVHEWEAREGGRFRVSLTYRGAEAGKSGGHTDTYAGRFARLVNRINHRRVNHGCRAFRSNAALELAGDRHTQLMVADREVSHQLSGEAALGTRVTRAGYTHWRIVAENLAWGQSSPRAVFRAWVHSAGHRANLDNCRLRDIGIAVVLRSGRPWVTADFGRRVVR
jgi:uncharacterized protein YkwD